MKHLVAVTFAALVVSGCGSTGAVQESLRTFDFPSSSQDQSAEIGEPIVTSVTGYARPAIKITAPVDFAAGDFQLRLKPGTYKADTSTPSGTAAYVHNAVSGVNARVSYSQIKIMISGGSCYMEPQSIQVQDDAQVKDLAGNQITENIEGIVSGARGIFGVGSGSIDPQKDGVIALDKDKCQPDYAFSQNQAGGIKRELIYLGFNGDSVRLKYREYYDNLARAAFSNDLTYDISGDNVIGFRGARIEILDATNTGLSYRIIDHMK